MYKLNQKGWGLSLFIIFLAVFFIAIILISIGAEKMGIGSHPNIPSTPISTPSETRHYTDAEIKQAMEFESTIKEATNKYLLEVYGGQWSEDRKVITVTRLIENRYLESFSVAGNNCHGYVKVESIGGTLSYTPYVSCGDVYTTMGYDYALD